MSEQKFLLILTGTLIEGFDWEESASQLSQLLRLPEEQAFKLLRGEKSIIRKPLPFTKADHLREKLVARGIDCHLRELNPSASEPKPSPAEEQAALEVESVVEAPVVEKEVSTEAPSVTPANLSLEFEMDEGVENDGDSASEPSSVGNASDDEWPDELELVPIQVGQDEDELEDEVMLKGEEIVLASAPPPDKVIKFVMPTPEDDEPEQSEDALPEPEGEKEKEESEPASADKPDDDSSLNTGTFFEQPNVIKIEEEPSTAPDYQKYLLPAAGALVAVIAVVLGLTLFSGDSSDGDIAVVRESTAPVEPAPPANPQLAATEQRLDNLFRSVRVWMIQFGSGFDPNQVTLERLQQDLGLSDSDMTDGWGHPFEYTIEGQEYRVASAGPDGQLGNDDDLVKQGNGMR